MKNILYFLFFIAVSYKATAQITYIPDQGFEQALINLEIDSDGIINGQVLTSDIENVTELNFDPLNGGIPWIYDLTGIQDFVSLEKLTIKYSYITELDISQNLQLRELYCGSNELTSLDVSSNILLEKLYIGNYGIDVGPFNMIEEIDLSNNPNIYVLNAYDMSTLKKINLKNDNNNSNMNIVVSVYPWGMDEPDYDPYEIRNTICIGVDDENLAQNNQYPYSEWNITHGGHVAVNFSDECNLNISDFTQNKINIYPNPVSDILYFETAGVTIEKVMIFDLSGRKVLEQNQVNIISVSDLQKGNYILKIFSDKGVQTEKIIVK